MNEKETRIQLIALLEGGNAHAKFNEVVDNFPSTHINNVFEGVPYTPWQLLEHMRMSQADILEFITNPNYKGKEWPKGYWPPKNKKAAKRDWQKSVKMFNNDLSKLKQIAKNPKTDLYSRIRHGDGQNIFREILLVADHNAYHLGELVLIERVMKVWNK